MQWAPLIFNGWTDPSLRFTLVSSDPVGTNGDEGFGNPDPPLPVKLTTFSAFVVENNVALNWETATEVNNYGFELERKNPEVSSQNSEWNKIGFSEGHGNSNSVKKHSFFDNSIFECGIYWYRLKQIDIDGKYEYSQVIEIEIGIPKEFEVAQNYPNPFNPSTTFAFSLPEKRNVKVVVYNILGEVVKILVNQELEAGKYKYEFNASNLSSRTYIYRVAADEHLETKKCY